MSTVKSRPIGNITFIRRDFANIQIGTITNSSGGGPARIVFVHHYDQDSDKVEVGNKYSYDLETSDPHLALLEYWQPTISGAIDAAIGEENSELNSAVLYSHVAQSNRKIAVDLKDES